MELAARIKKLDFRQIFLLSRVFIFQPLFIVPILKSTKKTLQICNEHFGKDHHKNTGANAFRHALWNFLICKNCYKTSKSVEKAINWSKKVSDLHENLFPNRELPRQMDLHNNQIGRKLFEEHFSEEIEIISVLKEKMKEAVQISGVGDLEKAQNKLVFIEN